MMEELEKKSIYTAPGQTFGRPSTYTDELADVICEIISTHPQADHVLCDMYSFFPHVYTLWEWRNKYEYFAQKYARAKEAQITNKIEDIYKECDDREQDFKEHKDRLYSNNVRGNLMRAKMGFLQWHAGILNPEKYGSKKSDTVINVVTPEIMAQAREILERNHAAQSRATTTSESSD